MIRKTTLPNGNILEESIGERSTIFRVIDPEGNFVSAGFSCKIDPDNPEYLAAMYPMEDFIEDMERNEFLKKHDPNRIDSRKVRKELGDDFVNLGRRVNRVPNGAERWYRRR